MRSAEQVLLEAADNGDLNSEDWPRALEYILKRLDEIINDFPKPVQPSPAPQLAPSAGSPSRSQNISSQEFQNTDKENAPPPVNPSWGDAVALAPRSPSQGSANFSNETNRFYTSIRTSLSKNFPTHPPHTIQRLAELVLEPKRRYKFLPSYLRALDRVVSVSSPTIAFPLPAAVLPNTGGLLNGTSTAPSLGSDESLGGALLTPIPWLRHDRGSQSELVSESTEIVDGPNGAGRIETVSVVNGHLVNSSAPSSSALNSSASDIANSEPLSLGDPGSVTQGELLRQEQEAGVVLSNPHSVPSQRSMHIAEVEGQGSVRETVETDDEMPHARGPDEIGALDIGSQNDRSRGLDIEAAMGRSAIRQQTPDREEKEGGASDVEMVGAEESKEEKNGEAGKEKNRGQDGGEMSTGE
ncbi:hypothetical protein GQ43DRAFT_443718 [Delitschia confertaspora ATCC 74209]|uniref:Protein phosphatase 4 core regulatory subunit R2 n=1 Tax=Delitschia confertaspora ATCC 74209 TaxID=1513339 RepID=A0A9P4JHE3_9PLEO|nr:hypothetical protein GQ43DRAFT_443718 [Delitschia confertaspora ATCC 74209]